MEFSKKALEYPQAQMEDVQRHAVLLWELKTQEDPRAAVTTFLQTVYNKDQRDAHWESIWGYFREKLLYKNSIQEIGYAGVELKKENCESILNHLSQVQKQDKKARPYIKIYLLYLVQCQDTHEAASEWLEEYIHDPFWSFHMEFITIIEEKNGIYLPINLLVQLKEGKAALQEAWGSSINSDKLAQLRDLTKKLNRKPKPTDGAPF